MTTEQYVVVRCISNEAEPHPVFEEYYINKEEVEPEVYDDNSAPQHHGVKRIHLWEGEEDGNCKRSCKVRAQVCSVLFNN